MIIQETFFKTPLSNTWTELLLCAKAFAKCYDGYQKSTMLVLVLKESALHEHESV